MNSIKSAVRTVRARLKAWRNRAACRFVPRARRAARGRKYLVTGATGGIGEAAAIELVASGASVLVHGRSTQRLADTVGRLSAQARDGARIWSYQADLADPTELDKLLQQVRRDHRHLDGLINNAGVGIVPERRVDGRGLEGVWAVNVVAPWQLAQGLAQMLAKGHSPRILNLVSSLKREIGDDLMMESGYDPFHAYARSKQAMVVLTVALAEQFRAQGIAVNALDPGGIDTPMFAGFGLDYNGMPPSQAGKLLGRMIADPALSRSSGLLYSIGRRIELPRQALDAEFRARLVDSVRAHAARRTTPAAR